ncbi:MAG TPA: hypothetical protein VH187_01625 [Scandinavium sp.]|jgi:hypothetical protein|uniref:phage tail assembly protein T n=1 Tax=Scandinavium sp. TaxID=2830653 RepID=UPI002E331A54|nr:hypothetical protein [Scandinavium sp.]HEX4499858.1 hypothetical protein [Scandinavium sp.]
MTRAELMRRMDSREFVEWQLYYALEPFGAERDAAHAAIVASTVANYSGFAKEPTQPKDFIARYDRVDESEMTPAQQHELQAKREHDLYEGLHALAQRSKPAGS